MPFCEKRACYGAVWLCVVSRWLGVSLAVVDEIKHAWQGREGITTRSSSPQAC